MRPRFRTLLRILSLLWLSLSIAAGFYNTGLAAQTDPLPEGFYLVETAPGVVLYRKDYQGGSPDYVQVIRLDQGAQLKLLHGAITESRPDAGSYGGPDPRMRSRAITDYWQELRSGNGTAFCILNGQFFYMLEYPTRLPFPLKVDGQIVTEGYGRNDFPDQKLMLEIWATYANIAPLSADGLHNSTAPNIVAGLAEDANKRAKHYTGRTFIGTDDLDGNGTFETLLIFNTKTARQVDAARILREFGAEQVMMLDGGGSTQLLCNGKSLIASERVLPQVIGVLAAPADYQPPTPDIPELTIASDDNPTAEVLPSITPTLPPGPTATIAPPTTEISATLQPVEIPVTETVSSTLAIILSNSAASITDGSLPESPAGTVASEELILARDVFWVPLLMAPGILIVLFVVMRQQFYSSY